MKGTTILLAASMAVLLAACGKQEAPPPPARAWHLRLRLHLLRRLHLLPPLRHRRRHPPPHRRLRPVRPGQGVYNRTCALCHAAGVAGAPKPGDKAEWEPRIAQGMDVLYQHSLEGFTGKKGMMPPRGGASNLSDEEVKAAVDFMVGQSQ
jgi:cytochrome c5